MSDLPVAPRARLFTAFGTLLYVDVASGELRHGLVGSNPANAVFAADPSSAGSHRRGLLLYVSGDSREPIVCLADRCHAVSQAKGANGLLPTPPTVLEMIPLERGLIALKAGEFFLSAIPCGRISLSAPACSTWELFLASEDWCTHALAMGNERSGNAAGSQFDKKRIKDYIVHPTIRARTNRKPNAKKLLIYGYTKWSHGRVYYDLCKHLHERGYIVDFLDWQVNHADYISEIISYYDLFMTALDGVRTLVDIYGVPYDRIIALSHHELDMRMLIEQKGIEVFGKFANYGVVSEFLYCASLMQGVPRVPMVASLGINYSEFHADIPKHLATVGYAGSMSVKTYDVEWKRGKLAEASARDAGLAFKVAGSTENQMSFHDMPEFYKTVDAVLATSVSEGAGLPVMEAAAAGRLVIGTPVGHFPLKAYHGGGIIAPIETEKFKAFAAATLRYYKENPTAYVDKCCSIQEAARKFDWRYSIDDWIELIETQVSVARTVPKIAEVGSREGDIYRHAPSEPRMDSVPETQKAFSKIYRNRGFGGSESFSGPGSTLAKTARLRKELPEALRSFGIKRIVDAPCGDMNWIRHLEYDFDLFIGVDIVTELIDRLRVEFPSDKYYFEVRDVCRHILPKADAILCRDCFVHLPYSKIWDAIRLFKMSGTQFLLTTTYPDKKNRDVSMGGWRPLNLVEEPFFWPAPIKLLGEVFPENADQWDNSKCIGVWDVSLLPDAQPAIESKMPTS